jgi:hypothetical protein
VLKRSSPLSSSRSHAKWMVTGSRSCVRAWRSRPMLRLQASTSASWTAFHWSLPWPVCSRQYHWATADSGSAVGVSALNSSNCGRPAWSPA